MKQAYSVRLVLEAIESVRSRAREAQAIGDYITYSNLMGDLYALELCLVGEATKLVDALDKKAA